MARFLTPLVFLEIITSDRLKGQFINLFSKLGLDNTSISGGDENTSEKRFGFTVDVAHVKNRTLMRKEIIYFGYFPKNPTTDPKVVSTTIWLHLYLFLDDGSLNPTLINTIRKVQKECHGDPLGIPPLLYYRLNELDRDLLKKIIDETHQAVLEC